MRERLLSGISIFLEQDFFWPPRNEDRNYTMGFGIRSSGRWVREAYFDRPLHWLNVLTGLDTIYSDWLLSKPGSVSSHSLMLAGNGFTPDRLRATAPETSDRPYASLIALSVAHAFVADTRNWTLTTELTIGALGLRLSEVAQTAIHKGMGGSDEETPYVPKGWSNQVSDGGEPTARYAASFRYRTFHNRWFDAVLDAQASIGYYTNIAAGATVRAGFIRTPYYGFATNALSLVNQALGRSTTTRIGSFDAYVFAATRVRIVAYNALMQGQFRTDSAHVLSPGQIERFVQEFELGIALGWRCVSLSYSVSGRSPEFRIDDKGRWHTWGAFFLSVTPGRDEGGS